MMGLRLLLAALLVLPDCLSYTCDRAPKNTIKPKLYNDRYVIEISGNPKGYIPKETYRITLKTDSPASFTEFFIVAEPENPLVQQTTAVGKFMLIDEMLATYTHKCPNAVIQTTTLQKNSVDVYWRAPPFDGGCIAIKATVIESSDTWFSDDGDLTKVLCAEDERNEDIQPLPLAHCSACHEAKYEIAFQGMWSRNTHPRNFPKDMWSTKLGDIVGASHKLGKAFWNYNDFASDGMRNLGETGDTKPLEVELIKMLKDDDVRTIIKARELSYPNITGTSYTVFRVDRDNHLLSLVSKITPSPDWIVGVSNLELCKNDSTWTESVSLNLYPWDIGTDDGLGYDSQDEPSNPFQTIRRIKSNSPNREESPFFDANGGHIKPIAKLFVTRQKVYEKNCEEDKEEASTQNENCELSDWSNWSSCSTSCVRTHDRKPLKEDCVQDNTQLQESETCEDCEPTECEDAEWGPWSQCSTTCGDGVKERFSLASSECASKETVNCNNEECEDLETEKPNQGPFISDNHVVLIAEKPVGDVVDCKVTDWSPWSVCDATAKCSKGHQYKHREILIHPQNGGKACPSRLQKSKRCKVPCSGGPHRPHFDEFPSDCVMGRWSSWSPCSSTCGYAVQQRTREIIRQSKNGGAICGARIDQRRCHLPLACTGTENLMIYK